MTKRRYGYTGAFFAMIIYLIGILIILIFNYYHSFTIEYKLVRYLNNENYVMEKLIWLNIKPYVTSSSNSNYPENQKTYRAPLNIDDLMGIYEYTAELKDKGKNIPVISNYGELKVNGYNDEYFKIDFTDKVVRGIFGVMGGLGILPNTLFYDKNFGFLFWDCDPHSNGLVMYPSGVKERTDTYHLRIPYSWSILKNCIDYAKYNTLTNRYNLESSFVIETDTYLPLFQSIKTGEVAIEKMIYLFKTKSAIGHGSLGE